jgi:putative ABC transport system ATP-binding protein
MTTPLIAFNKVAKDYSLGINTVRVLNDVTLSIHAGEFISIVGPSGSGKSTLMNLLGFLDIPSIGTYHFKDRKTESFTSDELADIRAHQVGFVFQSFHLLSQKTVLENVMLPLLYRDDIPKSKRVAMAKTALGKAQLEEKVWHNKTNAISGGQRQRVAIARSLVGNPTLLLADEPTGNLDTKTGAQVVATLTELNREHGTTVIMITHDDSLAQAADRIITIVDGEIMSDQLKKPV